MKPPDEPIGDGGAVFLSDMNEQEEADFHEKVDKGWGGFYKKVKNIGKQ